MILDTLMGSVIFEEDSLEVPQSELESQSNPADPSEFIHLKKYYLLEKIRTLKSTLDSSNISNSDLEILIVFGSELTYETLVRLVDNISDIIKLQISQKVKINDKQKKTATV